MKTTKGFTLIELMIVVAIIGLLSMIAIPNFSRYVAKAKRAEAYMNLNSIYAAQKAYWAENGQYTTILNGAGGAGWKPQGYHGGGASEQFYYTYGFAGGGEGASYFTGKLQTSSSSLAGSRADTQGFVAIAAADIDGDGQQDVIAIDHNGTITIIEDDLI